MIRTDGIPTVAWANLKHVTQEEIDEEMVDEYIDWLLIENGYLLDEQSVELIWDNPWAEYDWLYEKDKPRDLVWDTEPDSD